MAAKTMTAGPPNSRPREVVSNIGGLSKVNLRGVIAASCGPIEVRCGRGFWYGGAALRIDGRGGALFKQSPGDGLSGRSVSFRYLCVQLASVLNKRVVIAELGPRTDWNVFEINELPIGDIRRFHS